MKTILIKNNTAGYLTNTEAKGAVKSMSSTKASGENAIAFGEFTTASGQGSYAEGTGSTSSGNFSHAEGELTTASGEGAHAEGDTSQAAGQWSHAEGRLTEARGAASHTEGYVTIASEDYSHAEGIETITTAEGQHVEGRYNDTDNTEDCLFVIGNGTDTNNRSNAMTVNKNGDVYIAGRVTAGSGLDGGLQDYINVKDYGAKGDGVTDDSDAIQAVFDIFSNENNPYKNIYFPAGVYIIAKPLTLSVKTTSRVQVLGYGATLQASNWENFVYTGEIPEEDIYKETLTFENSSVDEKYRECAVVNKFFKRTQFILTLNTAQPSVHSEYITFSGLMFDCKLIANGVFVNNFQNVRFTDCSIFRAYIGYEFRNVWYGAIDGKSNIVNSCYGIILSGTENNTLHFNNISMSGGIRFIENVTRIALPSQTSTGILITSPNIKAIKIKGVSIETYDYGIRQLGTLNSIKQLSHRRSTLLNIVDCYFEKNTIASIDLYNNNEDANIKKVFYGDNEQDNSIVTLSKLNANVNDLYEYLGNGYFKKQHSIAAAYSSYVTFPLAHYYFDINSIQITCRLLETANRAARTVELCGVPSGCIYNKTDKKMDNSIIYGSSAGLNLKGKTGKVETDSILGQGNVNIASIVNIFIPIIQNVHIANCYYNSGTEATATVIPGYGNFHFEDNLNINIVEKNKDMTYATNIINTDLTQSQNYNSETIPEFDLTGYLNDIPKNLDYSKILNNNHSDNIKIQSNKNLLGIKDNHYLSQVSPYFQLYYTIDPLIFPNMPIVENSIFTNNFYSSSTKDYYGIEVFNGELKYRKIGESYYKKLGYAGCDLYNELIKLRKGKQTFLQAYDITAIDNIGTPYYCNELEDNVYLIKTNDTKYYLINSELYNLLLNGSIQESGSDFWKNYSVIGTTQELCDQIATQASIKYYDIYTNQIIKAIFNSDTQLMELYIDKNIFGVSIAQFNLKYTQDLENNLIDQMGQIDINEEVIKSWASRLIFYQPAKDQYFVYAPEVSKNTITTLINFPYNKGKIIE